MNFNNKSPFNNIYIELLSKTYEQYLHYKRLNDFQALYVLNNNKNKNNKGTDSSSIDDILLHESIALSDKITNTAQAISERLKINEEFNYSMTYNWFYTKNKIVQNYYNTFRLLGGSDRRSSMLESQLIDIDKNILDEKVKCWNDILKPMQYFIELHGKYQALKQDRKLLE